MSNMFDFLEAWMELKLEPLTDKQLQSLKELLVNGIKEIEREEKRRK